MPTKVTKTRPFAGTVVVLVMRSFQLGALSPKTTAIGGRREGGGAGSVNSSGAAPTAIAAAPVTSGSNSMRKAPCGSDVLLGPVPPPGPVSRGLTPPTVPTVPINPVAVPAARRASRGAGAGASD